MKAEVNLITGYSLSCDERRNSSSKGCSTMNTATINEEAMKEILRQKEQKFIDNMYY